MSSDLGLLINNYRYSDSAIALDPEDTYQFQLGKGGSWRFGVTGLENAVDLVLRNAEGTILRTSTLTDAAGALTLNDLLPGDYSLQILRGDRDTPYTLTLDPITGSPLESGYGVTKDTEVKVEIADADKGDREIGLFSLNGMEQFAPDSPAYYQEAARRVLSNSHLGQLLVSQSSQLSPVSGSFSWESNLNGELEGVEYRTTQTLFMEAGDKFGLMMVPKGTIQEVLDNPNKLNGNNRPVFSLDTNAGGGFQFRQQETDEGTLFTIDKDGNPNDIVIYIDKDTEDAIAPQPLAPEEPEPTPVAEEPTPVAAEKNQLTPTPPAENPAIATPENNNIPPKELDFGIETDTFGKPITIAGSVSDRNGFTDIQRVEFLLQTQGEGWTAIGSVTNFAVNASEDTVANFTYQWTEGLAAGDYKVKAIAYDLAGKSSNVVVENFTVVDETEETPDKPTPQGPPEDKPTLPPQAIDKVPDRNPLVISTPTEPTLPGELPNSIPGDLRFAINPLYTTGETLSFEGGKVVDADGTSDLNRIEFAIRKIGGEWLYAGEVTEFTPESNGMSRFGFTYDLSELKPGQYELRAVAYDSEGAESNIATENFAVITAPGGNGLSDEVKLDMAGAANLGRYTPEELAKTREWVVWLTPGVSAEELAASVGAVNLGETGQIANTYIWEFAEGPKPKTTPGYIANLLAELDGVEFAYPEVPVPLKLMSTLSEDWFKDHWNLWSDINSSVPSSVTHAWEIIDPVTNLPIRGRNSTIATVDDGMDYRHSHFISRYNPNISWDFTDSDADPSPRSQERFEGEAGKPVIDGNRVWLPVAVNLTGLVTDTNFNLEFKGKKPLSLDQATFRLYSPTHTEKDPFDWQSFGGYWWRFPGWENSRATQRHKLSIPQGNKPINLDLDDAFEGTYAAGWWHLEISVSVDHPNPTQLLQDITNQIKSWSVDLEVANPHGTLVAGVAQANGDKIFGVAPESQLAAIRLIGNIDPVTYSYDSQGYTIANALFDAKQSSDRLNRNQEIDVFNNSWGPQYMRQLPLAVTALESGFKLGRDGRGNIYVFSAGNDGSEIGHVNYNNLANSRAVIPVGAISRQGVLSEYSTQAPFVVAYSDSGRKDPDAITTTAITFNEGRVTDFGGTSAAAPFVSGVIALMLEVNPNLTSRDVQYILAETAYKTDPTHPDWQQNGGGYHINEHYGFGAVDPVAAVMAAKDWTTVGEEIKVSGKNKLKNVLNEIKDNQKLTDAIAITEDITVEHAEVLVNIDHPDWKDLTIVLKSPDGTESYLMKSIPDDPYGIGKTYEVHPGSNHWTFTSINHWGESSQGEWTLEVYDKKGNQIEGEWVSWQLNLYGTPPTVTIAATQPNASEDGTPGQFTVTRTGNNKNPLTVNYAIDGSATTGEDYQPLTGTVTIPAGQSSFTFNVNPIDDSIGEADETVEVTLIEDSAYRVGTEDSATVTISDEPILVQITASDPLAIENGNAGQFVIELIGDTPTTPLTVNYTVSGTAINGIDYQELSGSVTVAPGQKMARIGAIPIPDDELEENETIIVSLATGDYQIGTSASDTVILADLSQAPQGVNTVIADSINDFSLAQGQNNWYYGYYDGSLTSQDFQLLTNTDPEKGWIIDGADYWNSTYWTHVGKTEVHPSGLIPSVRQSIEQWAVRRWVSEVNGNISISGFLARPDTRDNGVIGRIFVDGLEIWSQEITGIEGATGITYDLNTNVEKGSVVDFVIDPNNHDQYNDTAEFSATISQSQPVINNTNPVYTNPNTGHRYFLSTLDTWLGAQEQAEALGGNLVTINDAEEQQWLIDTFGGETGYWIGLMDSEIYGTPEGTFQWVDGSPITYENWHPTEPNNSLSTPEGGEDFVNTNHDINNFPNQGKWNDLPNDYTIDENGVRYDFSRAGIIEIDPATFNLGPTVSTSASAYMSWEPEEIPSYLGLSSDIDPIKLAQFLADTYEGIELERDSNGEIIFVNDVPGIIADAYIAGGMIIEPEILESLKKEPFGVVNITAEPVP
ncbi:S8 family serine peptidase [Laspinema olomoucense]|uniref:S8 family serine peptidase n=1 Tax=Laspinema olomoucense TaxID=3231600 RepID=UPI0021BA5C34|nr:S8 family serine peptidase [Laspinema sp. D3c]MCT7996112.1 S8 family serine peptidase [Laspinema sp. D3c]